MPTLSPATVPEATGLHDLGEAWRIVARRRDKCRPWTYVAGLVPGDMRGLSTVTGPDEEGSVLYAHLPPEPAPKQFRGGRMR